jgi:hypothetical protein
MNAKEISDATLPTVTPAADDLMILYDVSAGTTGKTPISGIAPKVAENIVPRSTGMTIISQNSTLSSPLKFTAPFSGLFFITLSKSSAGWGPSMLVNGTQVFETANWAIAYSNVLFAFVRQGDDVTVLATSDGDEFIIQTAGLQKIDWIKV